LASLHGFSDSVRSRIRHAALAAWLSLAPAAHGAADVDPALQERLLHLSPAEHVSVLVKVAEPRGRAVDAPSLAGLERNLAVRHDRVLTHLKSRAAESQRDLSATLETDVRAGRARSVRSFWIDNLVGLEATPALIRELALRPDVERIVLLPQAVIDAPELAPSASATVENSLAAIGAPVLWAQGFTGKGRIVCGIDTGVRGTHYALAARWRGNKVPWQEAWFDPRGLTSFPGDIGTNPLNHGSHTMGTMCGADPVRGDTVGVAPDAEWIAAFGIGGANLTTMDLIACMEWAADPDGHPNTNADVPDVINCSWRFPVQGILYPCNDIMDGVITNLEAAGVIVIWAAGNEGDDPGSVGYPANSGTAFGTNFAVGNYNTTSDTIVPSSSRGPSPCPGDNIKPEVVAPGILIRSCYRGNDSLYGILSGTSMAAPHVAGAAAVLRQMAPNATPAEIKRALYVSAIDKGAPGEDNDHGMGLVNLPAAADSLSVILGGPELRVEAEDLVLASGLATTGPGDSLHAGDTVTLYLRIRNRSESPATSAYVKLVETDPYVSVLQDSVSLGILAAGDSATAGGLRFLVASGTPVGQPLHLSVHLGAVGYLESQPLEYFTEPAPLAGLFTHDNTLVTFTVTNYGQFGLADESYYPDGGLGFLVDPSLVNHLAEAALVIGRGPNQVSDAARRSGGADAGYQVTDADFAPSPGGALLQVPNLGTAFQTTFSQFDDAAAENPLGIRVKQWTLIFPRGADEGYVLVIQTLENISGGPLSGVYAGILHDCDFPSFLAGADSTAFLAGEDLSCMIEEGGAAAGSCRGVAVVSPGGATAYRAINAQDDFYSALTYEVILTDSTKWDYLSGGIGPGYVPMFPGDGGTFVGTGPFTLNAPGDTVQIAFAFVGSEEGVGRLVQNAQAARSRYNAIVSEVKVGDDPVVPGAFTLHPNTPNPFNPETNIAFTLDQPAQVNLRIYNLLGQEVVTLLAASLPAGRFETTWNARDAQGREVATGVYFYRLQAGGGTQTRKMLLLR
jgi:bacillopeptidase F